MPSDSLWLIESESKRKRKREKKIVKESGRPITGLNMRKGEERKARSKGRSKGV